MRFRLIILVGSFLLVLTAAHGVASQAPTSEDSLAYRARQEFREQKFSDAERDFRELVKRQPSDIDAQVMLGNCLFRQEKYPEAIIPYERARELQHRVTVLTLDQRRIL